MDNNKIFFTNNLFKGIGENELNNIMKHFNKEEFQKNESIFIEGDILDRLYIIYSGKHEITKYSLDGTKNIVAILEAGDMFAESVALSVDSISPYSVTCLEDSVVYSIKINNYNTIMNEFSQLGINMQRILAMKNAYLTFKIDCISKKTIKERVYEILRYYYIKNNSTKFELPFNKNQLADFLCVNRSSLSREMSAMVDEGVFTYKKKIYSINEDFFKM
ncbi:MAG: Crp/Fnr family transcriptional regulator [Erysipelotrichales bacterium]